MDTETKRCTRCGGEGPFSRRGRGSTRLQSHCMACVRDYRRVQRAKLRGEGGKREKYRKGWPALRDAATPEEALSILKRGSREFGVSVRWMIEVGEMLERARDLVA